MAIPGGYRFAAPFDEVFPEGAYVLGVEQAFEWDRNGNKTPAKDNVTGQLVWNVQVTEVFEGLTAMTYEQNGGVQFSLHAKEMRAPRAANVNHGGGKSGQSEQAAA